MAVEYYIKAVCDQCGRVIEPLTRLSGKTAINAELWKWNDKWKAKGVMRGLRPMRRQAKLYCAKCAGT